MGRLVALGLFERAEDQTFVPTKELREVEIAGVAIASPGNCGTTVNTDLPALPPFPASMTQAKLDLTVPIRFSPR
jgi:hypothetical protein